MAVKSKQHAWSTRPSKRRQRTPSLGEMLAQYPASVELTDEDRAWNSMPPAGGRAILEAGWSTPLSRQAHCPASHARKDELKTKTYLKHSMPCLSDRAIDVDIDHERHVVRLTMDIFDSSLVATAVTHVLLTEHQVVAYRDDNEKNDTNWLTKSVAYELLVEIGGMTCRAQVVRLIGRDDVPVAVTLEPLDRREQDELRARQRRALDDTAGDARRNGLEYIRRNVMRSLTST
jgi:hypothetical protein